MKVTLHSVEAKKQSQLQKLLQATFLVAVLVVSLLSGFTTARAQATSLFSDAADASVEAAYARPETVSRSRLVNVNTSMLFNADGSPLGAKSQIKFNLFSDVNYTGVVTRSQKSANGYTWMGKLAGKSGGYFYVLTYDDAFIAHIASSEGVYEVSFAAGSRNAYRIIQVNQAKFVDHPASATDESAVGPAADPAADFGPAADSGSQIDILVVYTAAARAADGGTAQIKARIALAVTETNQGYANSGVTPRLRLVHTEEVAYTETGNIGTDVARLAGTADGYIDNVHTIRNTYAADMVGMIVNNGGGYCGMANAIMATAATAFQVTARDCATGYYSFGHEFGHLQGARHDTYVDPTNTPYSYGHGYTYPSASWRTIMAYNNACSAVGKNCTRLQYWSNPAKTYGGVPMGVANTKNYQVLNNTAYTVANFRASKIAQNISTSFTSTAGWAGVYGSWSIFSSTYLRTLGVAGYLSSIRTAGQYGDQVYEVKMKRAGSSSTLANILLLRGNYALNADKSWKPSYRFQYSNSGSFSVYEMDSVGGIVTLKGWTASAAIVPNGWNVLKVIAVGSTLKFYINNTLVWTGTDTTLSVGYSGIQMYRSTTSTGDVLDVDYATLSTNATAADLNMDEAVADGVELSGGTPDEAPAP